MNLPLQIDQQRPLFHADSGCRFGKLTAGFVLVLFLVSGCRSQKSKTVIEIKNFSSKTIVVDAITQFDMDDAEINLQPRVISITETSAQEIPAEFSIFWRFDQSLGGRSARQVSKISLAAIPETQRTSKIVLEFTSDERWVAHFE